MACKLCGVEGPLEHVSFHSNLGMLVVRTYRKVEGDLCKDCIDKIFWKFTLTNLVGWLGLVSAILVPLFLINNTVYFIKSRKLAYPTDYDRAKRPSKTAMALGSQNRDKNLNAEVIKKLTPYIKEINELAAQYKTIQELAKYASFKYGVSEEEFIAFVRLLKNIRQARKK